MQDGDEWCYCVLVGVFETSPGADPGGNWKPLSVCNEVRCCSSLSSKGQWFFGRSYMSWSCIAAVWNVE